MFYNGENIARQPSHISDLLSDGALLISKNFFQTPLSKKIVTFNNLKNAFSGTKYAYLTNFVKTHNQILSNQLNESPMLHLWTAFGDVNGNTTEDGYILNKNVDIDVVHIRQFFCNSEESTNNIRFLCHPCILDKYNIYIYIGTVISDKNLKFNAFTKLTTVSKKVGSLYYHYIGYKFTYPPANIHEYEYNVKHTIKDGKSVHIIKINKNIKTGSRFEIMFSIWK